MAARLSYSRSFSNIERGPFVDVPEPFGIDSKCSWLVRFSFFPLLLVLSLEPARLFYAFDESLFE